ncbi:MAG: FixH family protein [Georgfuchsia sp.]
MNKSIPAAGKPWYREPWPWLLAGGPLLVIVASLISAWIAIRSSDGLVSEDYYREGLAAQETIARSDKAQEQGLTARVRLTADALNVQLSASVPDYQLPPALRVTLSHPTRAGLDQTQLIPREGSGYAGRLRLPAAGHWLILIEDDAKVWRMMGSVVLPANGAIVIGEALPPEAHQP